MPALDPDEQRAASREGWEAVATGWESGADPFYEATLPISHWMVDRLAPQPGQTILELAAGRGDTGFLAAELLRPGGRLISTDGAEAMVEIARRRGERLGLDNVEYRTMELEWIDAKAASLDGILCRFGFMLAVDPEAALREARRVLRPGGRLVLAVWDVPEANPWIAVPGREAVRAGHVERPGPGEAGPFALSAPGAIAEVIEDAGFDAPEVTALDITVRSPSLDVLWDSLGALSSTMRDLLGRLAPADHYRLRDAIEGAWAPHVAADGSVALPGRAIGAAAEA